MESMSPPGSDQDDFDMEESQTEEQKSYFDQLLYRTFFTMFSRFADFFSIYSSTYVCADYMSQLEASMQEMIMPSETSQERTTKTVSEHLSALLELSHPTSLACSQSWSTELTAKANYIDLSTTKGVFKAIQNWVT